MGRIYGYYEWDDTVGNPGHRDDGSLHQNLYNEDRVLSGHARFVPDEDRFDKNDEYSYENTFVPSDYRRESEEKDELAEAIAEVILAFTIVGISKAAPHVKQWWKEQARPSISRQTQKVRNIRRKKRRHDEIHDLAEKERLAVEINRQQIMSSEEALSRVIAALAARVYSEEQMQMVRSARIVGIDENAEIERIVMEFPSKKLQALIAGMAKNPAFLEDASLANLASTFTSQNQIHELLHGPAHRKDPDS